MTMPPWTARVAELNKHLSSLTCLDGGRLEIPVDMAFDHWRNLTEALRSSRNTVYLIGNGASASMASHFAADLNKNASVKTGVFSDLSLMTALANDMGYEHVFAEPLRQHAVAGDMLVAISSSGKSTNILAAAEVARARGVQVVTLSGMQRDNPLRVAGSLNFHVGALSYGFVETCHAAILHHWMDMMELPDHP